MTTSRILPVLGLVAALVGTGAVVATAQNLDPAAPDVSAMPVDFGHGGGRHGRGGPDGGEGGGFGLGGGRGGAMFADLLARVDADGDGALTQAEIDSFRAAQVTAADASKDGALALEEFQTVWLDLMRPRMVDAFQDLDADGDGSVTAAEMDARFGSVVDRLDRNGDGMISPDDALRGRRG